MSTINKIFKQYQNKSVLKGPTVSIQNPISIESNRHFEKHQIQ